MAKIVTCAEAQDAAADPLHINSRRPATVAPATTTVTVEWAAIRADQPVDLHRTTAASSRPCSISIRAIVTIHATARRCIGAGWRRLRMTRDTIRAIEEARHHLTKTCG